MSLFSGFPALFRQLPIVLFFLVAWQNSILGSPWEDPGRDEKNDWHSQAKTVLTELREVIASKTEWPNGNPIPDWREAEQLIWKLWMVTGHPPVLETSTRLDPLSESHVDDYRQFINEHAELSPGQLHKLGVFNARASIASPLCYNTLKYVDAITGNSAAQSPIIYTTPSKSIILLLPDEEDCRELSDAYMRWLRSSFRHATWNSERGRFEAINQSLGTEELHDVVTQICRKGAHHRARARARAALMDEMESSSESSETTKAEQ